MSKQGAWEKIRKVQETQNLLDRTKAELELSNNFKPGVLLKANPVYKNCGLGFFGSCMILFGAYELYRPIPIEKLLATLLIIIGVASFLLHLSLTPAVETASTSGDASDDSENSE